MRGDEKMRSPGELSRRRPVRGKAGVRGQAMVEVALLSPWIFFLFVGVMDTGFFCYTAICVENAARAAAFSTAVSQTEVSGTSNDNACVAAWNELSNLPNVYSATPPTGCSGLPAVVTVVTKTLCGSSTTNVNGCTSGTATNPSCSDCDGTAWDGTNAANPDKTAASAQAAVTYTSAGVVPIPGIFPTHYTLTRIAESRIIQE